MYSPLATQRFSVPSHLRMAVKTTQRAGMLRPMANVSVVKRTYTWKEEGSALS
jgi:hypothetical protein